MRAFLVVYSYDNNVLRQIPLDGHATNTKTTFHPLALAARNLHRGEMQTVALHTLPEENDRLERFIVLRPGAGGGEWYDKYRIQPLPRPKPRQNRQRVKPQA